MKRKNCLFCFLLFLTVLMIADTPFLRAEDKSQELKEQIKALQNRVQQLEAKLEEESAAESHRGDFLGSEWDPFLEMERIHREMNRMFQDSYGRGIGSPTGNLMNANPFFDPQIDITEADNQYIFKIDLPGMDKESINVEIKDRMLLISGERNVTTEERNDNQFYRRERSFGKFSRMLPLPDDAKTDTLEADYENGVLTVKVGRSKSVDKDIIESKKIPVY